METEITHVPDRRRRLDPGIYGQLVRRFIDYLEDLGCTPVTVAFYSRSVRHFASWLVGSGVELANVDAKVVERFADHECNCHGALQRGRLIRDYINRVYRFVRYLSKIGIVPEAMEPEPPVIDARVAAFQDWLRRHRGISEITIERHGGMLMRLLPALGDDPACYSAWLIRQALLDYSRTAGSRHYLRMMATALRGYLRFLAARGDCSVGLDLAVPSAKHWRLSALPRYLPAEDVERLVSSCDITQPSGIRDRAILLLLARLGLRAGDVSAMRLDDIEWEQGTLRVCGKGRREIRLPLPQDAGDAVLDYLTRARPASASDIVFLRLLPPHTPFATSLSVGSVVDRALTRAGIQNAPSRGSNLLRHSAATAMLRAGATLYTIGTVLRHRSLDTTAHYAKVDVGMLSEIAQPWPVMKTASSHARSELVRLRRIVQPWPGELPC